MRFIIVAMALGILVACDRTAANPPVTATSSPTPRLQCATVASERDTTCILFDPSLIALIARPELYDGKRVRVTGFANIEFEGNAIYVSREDYSQMIVKNGLWLEMPDSLAKPIRSRLPGYVLVEGEFHADDHGHFGMWSGAIRNVTRFEPSFSRADIPKRVPDAR